MENHAIRGHAQGSQIQNIGVTGAAQFEPDMPSTLENIGVEGVAGGSDYQNFAGKFSVSDTTGVAYGIYASVEGVHPTDYAGYFNGDIAYTGTPYNVSDARLKDNVKDMEGALTRLAQLQPKDYEFKTADYPYITLPEGQQHGLIAQEVEQIFPELVSDIIAPELRDTLGNVLTPQTVVKGINYQGFIPLLISGMKEQQATISEQKNMIDSLSTELKTRLTEIESRLNNCCGSGIEYRQQNPEEEQVNRISVELNALQVVVLEQNVPNPFAEQTSISYFIPADAGRAQMHFTDLSGRVIKSVELEKGSGIVTVFAQNLTSGTYTYSLVIDGKVFETKRMVKTK